MFVWCPHLYEPWHLKHLVDRASGEDGTVAIWATVKVIRAKGTRLLCINSVWGSCKRFGSLYSGQSGDPQSNPFFNTTQQTLEILLFLLLVCLCHLSSFSTGNNSLSHCIIYCKSNCGLVFKMWVKVLNKHWIYFTIKLSTTCHYCNPFPPPVEDLLFDTPRRCTLIDSDAVKRCNEWRWWMRAAPVSVLPATAHNRLFDAVPVFWLGLALN